MRVVFATYITFRCGASVEGGVARHVIATSICTRKVSVFATTTYAQKVVRCPSVLGNVYRARAHLVHCAWSTRHYGTMEKLFPSTCVFNVNLRTIRRKVMRRRMACHRDAIETPMKYTMMSASTAIMLVLGFVATNVSATNPPNNNEEWVATISETGNVVSGSEWVKSALVTGNSSDNSTTVKLIFTSAFDKTPLCHIDPEYSGSGHITSVDTTSVTFSVFYPNVAYYGQVISDPGYAYTVDCDVLGLSN